MCVLGGPDKGWGSEVFIDQVGGFIKRWAQRSLTIIWSRKSIFIVTQTQNVSKGLDFISLGL